MTQPLMAEVLPSGPPSPLFMRWIKFDVDDAAGQVHHFECQVTQAAISSTGGATQSINTLCPDGSFSENAERTWQVAITAIQDVETAESLMLFLLEHDGEKATVTYYPKVTKAGSPVGRGWTGEVTLSPPDNIGGAASGNYATFTATLPFTGTPQMIDTQGNPVEPVAGPATGATAGSPGVWLPSGSMAPADMASAPLLTGQPAWAADQYNVTAGGNITWNGTAWVSYVGPRKQAVQVSDLFPSETQITASDATNATKLTTLGYVPQSATAWTTGNKFSAGTPAHDFNWTGTAWAPGAHS
jgi:hypothetical protein